MTVYRWLDSNEVDMRRIRPNVGGAPRAALPTWLTPQCADIVSLAASRRTQAPPTFLKSPLRELALTAFTVLH